MTDELVRTHLSSELRWWLVVFVAFTVAVISGACMLSDRELMALPVMLVIALSGAVYAGVCAGRASVWKHIAEAETTVTSG